MCYFLSLFLSTLFPFPNEVLVESPPCPPPSPPKKKKKRYITILPWVVISWGSGQKYEILLQFNTGSLASLKPWYYSRICFSSVFMDRVIIKWSFVFKKFLIKNKFTSCLLVTVVAQFTDKTTNSKKYINFLLFISWCINKLTSKTKFCSRKWSCPLQCLQPWFVKSTNMTNSVIPRPHTNLLHP